MPQPIDPALVRPSRPRAAPNTAVSAAIPLTLLAALAATPLWGGYVTLIVVFLLWKSAARVA